MLNLKQFFIFWQKVKSQVNSYWLKGKIDPISNVKVLRLYLDKHQHFKTTMKNPNVLRISGPFMIIIVLNQIATFVWFVVRCGLKNAHQNDICLQDIGLCAENMVTILPSIVNIIEEDLYDHLTIARIFALTMSKIIIQALKTMRQIGYRHDMN